ncbi:ARM repeat-containing protein [Didymella exigua CBS 183.55]|uniref:ARM repeat-containing protein n=1 Tax=Didymella exigua CBS 183.55 TaxID=1150837 RepID=A0A6A5S5T6_9PLEO|nr:ARM repeat-containing protein [Didymella exigua CBS 183.55]KAF1932857.1 ARM repeat-containing protein [Didymella exigua CBS 183.55]
MTTDSGHETTLPDEVIALLELGPERSDDVNASLKTLLNKFTTSPRSEPVGEALQVLGTAVGRQKAWQECFREAGLLEYVLHNLGDVSIPFALRKQYLRIIGNCVADNDINREVATKDISKLVDCLPSDDLTPIALAVLFNLCNEFDPAKAAAAVIRLDFTLSGYLAGHRIPDAALDYATELLSWTTEKLTAAQFNDDVSLDTFSDLVKVTLNYDEDHYHEYVAILVHYLQDPEFQAKAATQGMLGDMVTLMLDFESRLTAAEVEAVFEELAISKSPEKKTPDSTSVILAAQLIGNISAISATDTFAQRFNVRSQVIETIRAKLNASPSPCTICACVMLGNLAMSDEVCTDMVRIMELHLPLARILASSSKPALLYAAAGFMRHLAFPEANRALLADAGLLQTCMALLKQTDAAVRGESAAIIGKLVTSNLHNIIKVVCEKVGETVIPDAHPIVGVEASSESTILHQIVDQALVPAGPLPSTAMKNPTIELSRSIVTILRFLGRPSAEDNVDAIREQMLDVPLIARPLAKLVRQRFYADARSEGLLGLGLIAQTPNGAKLVLDEVSEDDGLLDAIREFAEGKDGGAGQQVVSSSGRDYQNAVVLLQAMQNNWVSSYENQP